MMKCQNKFVPTTSSLPYPIVVPKPTTSSLTERKQQDNKGTVNVWPGLQCLYRTIIYHYS